MGKFVLSVLLLACSVTGAFAQVEKGDSEVQMQGAVTTFDGFTLLLLNLTYGHFVTPNVEIGGGPTIVHTSTELFDITTTGLLAFGRYNFTTGSKLVPYANAQLYQFDVATDMFLDIPGEMNTQIGGGVKYFLSEYVAYDISGNIGIGLRSGDVSLLIFGGISAFF